MVILSLGKQWLPSWGRLTFSPGMHPLESISHVRVFPEHVDCLQNIEKMNPVTLKAPVHLKPTSEILTTFDLYFVAAASRPNTPSTQKEQLYQLAIDGLCHHFKSRLKSFAFPHFNGMLFNHQRGTCHDPTIQ